MSRRELALALLPAGLLTVGLSVLLRQGDWGTRLMTGLEALIYLAVFIVILSRDAVRPHLAALPRPHRAILAIFFALMLAGHFANDTRATFPFSAWSMYGRPESPATLEYYRSEGIDGGLRRIVINEAELFPSIGGSAIASKVKRLAAQALAPQHLPGHGPPQRRLTDWLHAVGDAYNQRHPERPVRAVELLRYSVSLRGRGRPGFAARPIWRVELAGERSR
jgi:hypothetical protein